MVLAYEMAFFPCNFAGVKITDRIDNAGEFFGSDLFILRMGDAQKSDAEQCG